MIPSRLTPAPRIPSSPDAIFVCESYRCTLAGKHCIDRQKVRTPFSNGHALIARIPSHLVRCASGQCEQGEEVAAALKPFGLSTKKMLTSAVRLSVRACEFCRKSMHRKKGESGPNYDKRKTCDAACREALSRKLKSDAEADPTRANMSTGSAARKVGSA